MNVARKAGPPCLWWEPPAGLCLRGTHRGTSLIRKRLLLGASSMPMPRALWWSYGGGHLAVSEVPMYGSWAVERRGGMGERAG